MATSNVNPGDRWTDRLSEYLDGGLEPAERAELESHLTTCARCATVLDDLRLVVERSRTLETPPPPFDLWPGVLAGIEAVEAEKTSPVAPGAPERAPVVDLRSHRGFWSRRVSFSLPQAVAAGLTLAVLSGAGMWLALRGPAVTTPGGQAPAPIASRATAPSSSHPSSTTTSDPADPADLGRVVSRSSEAADAPRQDPAKVVLVAFSDPRYDATIAELQAILDDGRGRLDTTTVRILEQNLAIIDQALEDARRAVAADPANSYLRTHLASTMRRKVDLLRRATVIVTAQQG